ncbi:Uncharacterised protein [Mycobacteroides abscessus subsp. massiliense]|nr:Uncharacterised protein [Mycobacteroides abscessus subsp. massiliense]
MHVRRHPGDPTGAECGAEDSEGHQSHGEVVGANLLKLGRGIAQFGHACGEKRCHTQVDDYRAEEIRGHSDRQQPHACRAEHPREQWHRREGDQILSVLSEDDCPEIAGQPQGPGQRGATSRFVRHGALPVAWLSAGPACRRGTSPPSAPSRRCRSAARGPARPAPNGFEGHGPR